VALKTRSNSEVGQSFSSVRFPLKESGKAVVCRRETSGGAGGTVPKFPVHAGAEGEYEKRQNPIWPEFE
jgi:hypothetical protein